MKFRPTALPSALFLVLACSRQPQDLKRGMEAFQRQDYGAAMALWQPLAEKGVAQAQVSLAEMFARGDGVPRNMAEAAKWYRLAAEQGWLLGA